MNLFTLTPAGWFAASTAIITGDVVIGELANIWFGAVIRGDVARITIGPRTNVQDNAVIHCDTGVPNTIGSDITIGHGAIVHGRSVGDGCLIGMHATLLGGSVIGKQCLIAAGAVVPPGLVVPDRMVVMGVPGKIVRPIKPEELEEMRINVEHYVEAARDYVAGKFNSVITAS